MAKAKKICRICGKEYIPCGYCENDKMAFHYRAFCCSRECAQVYLTRVLEARKQDSNNIKEEESNFEESNKSSASKSSKRKYTKKKTVESESREQIE